MTVLAINKLIPRAVRNNNPLNIRESERNEWRGELPLALNKVFDADFESFSNPVYGYRAGAVLLRNYKKMYGLNTISQIITKFAPSNENNTAAYIASVSKQTGIDANQPLTLNDAELADIMLAMHKHEAGGVYFGRMLINQALKVV